MLRLKCTLRFPDGQIVTASVESDSAEGERLVTYTGPVQRLWNRFEKADAGFLEWYFRAQAPQLGAELSVEREGEFERWAE